MKTKSNLPPNFIVDPNYKPGLRPITAAEMNAERARQKAADKAAMARAKASGNKTTKPNGWLTKLTPEQVEVLKRARVIEAKRKAAKQR